MKIVRTFVTVELARQLLQTTPHARSISLARVTRYAADMKAGAWSENGDTIKLDEAGVLVNGHHRMRAVALSGVGVWMILVYGVSPATLQTMDCGLPKRVSDWSDRANASSGYSLCAAVIRLIESSKTPESGSDRIKNAVWNEIGDDSIQFAIRSAKSRLARSAPARMSVCLVHRVDVDRASVMAERLSTLQAPIGSPEHTYIRQRTNQPTIATTAHARIAARIALAAVRDEEIHIIRAGNLDTLVRELSLEGIAKVLGVQVPAVGNDHVQVNH